MLNRRTVEMQILSLFSALNKVHRCREVAGRQGTDLGNGVRSGDSWSRSDILSKLSQNTI